ncbi:unnamed protein product [Mesocestoides corti]|nr:unnamed protein product [Mesocestoides corti]
MKADLIHIDGHSDMDYPRIIEDLPVGHPPINDKQISAMMQRNDQFIQAAIASHLVRTVYLILPTWTTNSTVATNASLGQTVMTNGQRQFCICFNEESDAVCQTRSLHTISEEIEVSPSQCVNRSHYQHIELNSRNAAGVLRFSKTRALPQNDTAHPLILDIDEDFFGVQLVGMVLANLDCEMQMAVHISESLREVLCLRKGTSDEEMLADAWFRGFINDIKSECLPDGECLDFLDNATLSGECQAAIRRSANGIDPTIACTDGDRVDFYVTRLAQVLAYLTPEQLDEVARIGACFENAWRTHAYEGQVGLCLGHNIPGASIVPEFVPSYRDLIGLGRNFTRIVKSILPRRPDVITIARSARDGYVVRHLQPLVEAVIIKVIKGVFNVSDENFHFSEYLAGGKGGWINRHSTNKSG